MKVLYQLSAGADPEISGGGYKFHIRCEDSKYVPFSPLKYTKN